MDVNIPDAKVQHYKTPALKRILRQILNELGQTETVVEWTEIVEGEDRNITVVKWGQLRDRIENWIRNATLDQCKTAYKTLTGEDYTGTQTKKAVLVALVKFYFPNADLSGTQDEILTRLKNVLMPKKGRWGLGCPHNCGRFWEFQPSEDLSKFEPVDPFAGFGLDAEGNPTKGYLNWDNGKFTCDRCRGEVTLK